MAPSSPNTNPIIHKIEQQLKKLRESEVSSISPIQTITIASTGLMGLYKCVNDALKYLPHLPNHDSKTHIEQIVNGSSKLLEACSASGDMLSRLSEAVKNLKSSDDKVVEVSRYFCTRKEIARSAKGLALRIREIEGELMSENKELSQKVAELIEVFRCVSIITILVMESLLRLLSLKTPGSSRFSGVSRMLGGRGEKAEKGNEIRDVDVLLRSVFSDERDEGRMMTVQKRLEELEAGLRGIENGLSGIFSQLTKARASLLKHRFVQQKFTFLNLSKIYISVDNTKILILR